MNAAYRKTKNNDQIQSNENDPEDSETIEYKEELMKVNPFMDLIIENNKLKTNKEIKFMEKVNYEMNQYGIENLKKVLVALSSLINDIVESIEDDGKFTASDFSHFVTTIPKIISAIPSISEAYKEGLDKITEEEYGEIKASVIDEIDFKDPIDDEFLSYLLDWLNVTANLIKNRIQKKKAKDEQQ